MYIGSPREFRELSSHSTPTNTNRQKVPTNSRHQRSRFSEVNIKIPDLSHLVTPTTSTSITSISALQGLDNKSLVSSGTVSNLDTPGRSVRVIQSHRHMSFSGTLVVSRGSEPLSANCLPSITKGRKLSVLGSDRTDFLSQTTSTQSFLSPKHFPSTSLTLEQKKEESELRQNATRQDVGELKSMKIMDRRASKMHTSAEIMQDAEKAFQLADRVLSAYGIHVRVHSIHASDSAMIILPIVEQRRLANFYKMFIPEMRKFNYIFISSLRVGAISVCSSLQLTNKKYSAIMEKKLRTGLFVLDRLPDKESVQQHWFKVILYHFLKAKPAFFKEWCDLLLEDTHVDKHSHPFDELLVSFNQFMGVSQENWENDIYMKTRVNMLCDAMETLGLNGDGTEQDEETSREVLRLLHLL